MLPAPKLPRRYKQRLGLHRALNEAPPCDPSDQTQPVRYEPRIQKKSDFDWDVVDNSDYDPDHDSGYGSTPDSEAIYLDQKMREFEEAGPTLANHCDGTLRLMAREEKRWRLFCQTVKIDPEETLIACKVARLKSYLLWRVKHSRIKKESTIMNYWKCLSMVYARTAHRYMDEGVLFDINNWIPLFGLDDSEKEKAGLFVEDLCVLQNGHWVRDTEVFTHERLRVQLSTLMTISGCTATRPSAIVGNNPLLYSDIEFQLFPPTTKGQTPTIIMKLSLKNIKRSGGKSREKIFTFYEEDNLPCSIVLFMLALAFADNAFKNKFNNPEALYNLVIPPDQDRIRLCWDETWAQRPIFRDVEDTVDGVRISDTKHLQYPKYRQHFIRLGRTCGFKKRLEFYDLRRGSGKNLTEALTSEECNQIMSHRSRSTYQRYYMPAFIDRDCQSIYLGHIRRDDLVRAVGRLVRHSRAPKFLNDAQKLEVNNNHKLQELYQKRDLCKQKIKGLGFSTIKAAKGETEWWQRFKDTKNGINSLKTKLTTARLQKAIKDFHDTVDTIEVDQQLQGIVPSAEVLTPSTIEYELQERATVAKLLFKTLDDFSEGHVLRVRLELIQALARLCKRQETPHQYKTIRLSTREQQCRRPDEPQMPAQVDAVIVDVSETVKETGNVNLGIQEAPQSSALYCAFCRRDKEAGPKKGDYQFSRIDSLGRHVRRKHLGHQAPTEGFNCPYHGCSAYLSCSMHFLNHTAHQHGLCLFLKQKITS